MPAAGPRCRTTYKCIDRSPAVAVVVATAAAAAAAATVVVLCLSWLRYILCCVECASATQE